MVKRDRAEIDFVFPDPEYLNFAPALSAVLLCPLAENRNGWPILSATVD